MSAPAVIGVCGAGTMGAGIAQLAALAGARTLLHDPVPAALEGGLAKVRADLERGVARGRWSAEEAADAAGRLEAAPALDALASCELVVEAAPEDLALKQGLFARLSAIAPRAVLATNTSSLPVTAIARGAGDAARVVGLHFFNPAPLMRLVEVVAGAASGAEALAVARAAGEAMGRRVIDAADGPGFLVNRVNRPFGLEALKLVQEGVAPVAEVDRVARLAGGFRMGPFELQDLVGIDVGLAVARSFHEQSFGEPRWRPSPLSQRMVDAGWTGRKAGRGWYAYGDGPHRPEDPAPRAPGGGGRRLVVVGGELPVARELRALAAAAGFDARTAAEAAGEVPWLVVDCGDEEVAPEGGPRLVLCAEGSLHGLEGATAAAGFHALPPLAGTRLLELTRGQGTSAVAAERAETFARALGCEPAWVGDAPGLVLGRIVSQLVNEACFAVAEGVGSAEDVDAGAVLGLNHPRGPFAWLEAAGAAHVVAVLDALHAELGEERYRVAPALRRAAG